MDRNSIIGLLLIGAILVTFSILNQPTKEEVEALERRRDSLELVEKKHAEEAREAIRAQQDQSTMAQTELTDSAKLQLRTDTLGAFANAAEGKDEYFTIENEKLKLTISSKGGRVVTAELKDYVTWDSLPLILFEEDRSDFGLRFFSGNRLINTSQLYFRPMGSSFEIKGEE
ncbi:MAG: YidC/Oxa1 family insertase periplasmic-domain containing protein, partial [Flavobacteriales bacterium]|nr:YidC/Oxa1 family insertase periplasmic-domain containing protein [Flavobacteriales bacterium]